MGALGTYYLATKHEDKAPSPPHPLPAVEAHTLTPLTYLLTLTPHPLPAVEAHPLTPLTYLLTLIPHPLPAVEAHTLTPLTYLLTLIPHPSPLTPHPLPAVQVQQTPWSVSSLHYLQPPPGPQYLSQEPWELISQLPCNHEDKE